MITFLILYFSNLVLDYPLQGKLLSELKQQHNYFLFVHCAIWALGLSLVLIPLNLFAWWKLLMLLVGHFAMDYWKCKRIYKKWPLFTNNEYNPKTDKYEDKLEPVFGDIESLYVDQVFHIFQLLLCLI